MYHEKSKGDNALQILHPTKGASAEYNEPSKVCEYEVDDSVDNILFLNEETSEELAKNVSGTRMLVERPGL